MFHILLLISAIFVHQIKCTCNSVAESAANDLKIDLLCSYDRETVPTTNNEKVNVTVRIVLKSIVYDMWSTKPSFTINNWLGVSWTDPALTWSPDSYGSIKVVHMDADEIWTPGLKHHYGIDRAVLDTASCRVQSTGKVVCATPSSSEAMCESNWLKYPFDLRTCTLGYASAYYGNRTIDLLTYAKPVILEVYTENPEWKLHYIIPYTLTTILQNESYQSLRYNFTFSRRPKGPVAHTVLPGLALGWINLLTPWLSPAGPERLAIAVISVGNHGLYMQQLFWQFLAHTYSNDTSPLLLSYATCSVLISVVLVVQALLVKSVLTSKEKKPPFWLLQSSQYVASGRLGKLLLIEGNVVQEGTNNDYTSLRELSKPELRGRHLISKVLDAITIIFTVFIYALIFLIVICL